MTSWKLKTLSGTGKKGCEINDGNCKIRRIKTVKRKGEREREGKEEEEEEERRCGVCLSLPPPSTRW